MAENDLENLEMLNLLIALEVRLAMQASIVITAATAEFAHFWKIGPTPVVIDSD